MLKMEVKEEGHPIKKKEEIIEVKDDELIKTERYSHKMIKAIEEERMRERMEIEVDNIFHRLREAEIEDSTALLFNSIAYHRVKVLDEIEETLRIVMAKKIFLKRNGLKVLLKYL